MSRSSIQVTNAKNPFHSSLPSKKNSSRFTKSLLDLFRNHKDDSRKTKYVVNFNSIQTDRTEISMKNAMKSQSDDNLSAYIISGRKPSKKKKVLKSETDCATKPPALKNFSTNCYLNSMLQGISSCQKFVEDIKSLSDQYGNKGKKLALFSNLLSFMNDGGQGQSKSKNISKNKVFKNWNKYYQQDCYEFLTFLLNEVYNEIRQKNPEEVSLSSFDKWLDFELPMRIIMSSEIHCKCDAKITMPLQSDFALHITITRNEANNLQDLFDKFFEKDLIDKFICHNRDCDGSHAFRTTSLQLPLPRTMCLHLQKTSWNGRKLRKIKNRIHLDKNLIVKNKFCVKRKSQYMKTAYKEDIGDRNSTLLSGSYCRNPSNNNNSESVSIASYDKKHEELSLNTNSTETKDDFNLIEDDKSESFTLMSVIVHSGTVNRGHYICYKFFHDTWYQTNDSKIKEVQESEVMDCDPYILFYEKL